MKQILKWYLPKYFCISFLFFSTTLIAGVYQKSDILDEDFLLLDIKSKKLTYLEAVDAYKVNKQILIPIGALLQSLELNFVISVSDGTIKLKNNNSTINIDLQNQITQGLTPNIDQDIYWTNEQDDLLVSHLLIEKLINATLDFNMSKLAITIENNKHQYPVEKRLERELRRTHIAVMNPAGIPDIVGNKVFSDEFILDTYKLFSPPSANINFNLLSINDDNTKSSTKTTFNNSIQSSFDLLYHYTQLTLNKQADNNIASNLTFTRHHGSPYETFPLGIKSYSFGDIYGKSDNLTLGNNSGIGLSVARRPVNYSRTFGKITLEDFAPPGWEIELYRGGVLLQTSTVPDDGRYVFENIETTYGTNKFEIKLFGPYGEEEVHHKNIRINSTQLKENQYGFDSYFMDAGNKLLGGLNSQSESFSPDTLGFAFDYGLSNELTLGLNFSQLKGSLNKEQHFLGSELQTSIPGALFNFNFSHQIGEGYAGLAAVSGRLWDNTTYQVFYEKNNNYQSENSNPNREEMSVSVSGNFWGSNYTNMVSYTTDNVTDKLSFINRLSGRLGAFSLTNFLYYDDLKLKISTSDTKSERISGSLSIAGSFANTSRLSGSVDYDLKNNFNINKFRLTATTRLTNKMNLNNNIEYFPQNENKWRINSNLAWLSKYASLNSGLSYAENGEWTINLGLKFSIGYDQNNNKWLMNSENMTTMGTLDINSYLDQNNNHRLDEGDVALPGVRFGPTKQWQNITSNKNGKTLLPFVSAFSPTSINATWIQGVSPSTRTYSVYTHPGSHISAQIPFTVKTTVVGFAMLNDEDGDPLVESTILLKNTKNKLISKIKTDDDGFFEFIDLEPGNYIVSIEQAYLDSRTLKSNPGSLEFITPPAGGYFELGVISAVPLAQTVTESARIVEPTIDNYEPIEEIENLLGIANLVNENTIDVNNKFRSTLENNLIKPITIQTPKKQLEDKSVITNKMLRTANVLTATNQKSSVTSQLKQSSVINSKQNKQLPEASNLMPKYSIQFATLSTEVQAINFVKKLIKYNIEAVSLFDNKIKSYRVLTGPFDTKSIAWRKSNELRNQGVTNFVRKWTTPNLIKGEITNNLPENGFSIQIMVAKHQNSIDQAINQGLLGSNLFQIRKQSDTQSLNVLLKGNYATRGQALKAMAQLPEEWKKNTWVRSMSDLRKEQIN